VLLHLVDATQADVADAYRTVRAEIRAYSPDLAKRKELVALSKSDAMLPEDLEAKTAELAKAARKKPLVLSAVTGQGMREVLFAITKEITSQKKKAKIEREAVEGQPGRWLP
jgi:GTP-binding protein